eukprot:GHVN01006843.1.p1 GENE.GHVN01006843.1~~GHVN01006843.1.p1  ORF type:complete len:364 (+),score=21.95 GHVN01006843.1:907-1998(+)
MEHRHESSYWRDGRHWVNQRWTCERLLDGEFHSSQPPKFKCSDGLMKETLFSLFHVQVLTERVCQYLNPPDVICLLSTCKRTRCLVHCPKFLESTILHGAAQVADIEEQSLHSLVDSPPLCLKNLLVKHYASNAEHAEVISPLALRKSFLAVRVDNSILVVDLNELNRHPHTKSPTKAEFAYLSSDYRYFEDEMTPCTRGIVKAWFFTSNDELVAVTKFFGVYAYDCQEGTEICLRNDSFRARNSDSPRGISDEMHIFQQPRQELTSCDFVAPKMAGGGADGTITLWEFSGNKELTHAGAISVLGCVGRRNAGMGEVRYVNLAKDGTHVVALCKAHPEVRFGFSSNFDIITRRRLFAAANTFR